MINKHQFKVQNTKKILHKVGKRWVVVSAILLGLMTGGSVVGANVSHVAANNRPQVEDHYDGQKFSDQINHKKNIQAYDNHQVNSLKAHKDSLAQNIDEKTSDYNRQFSSASASASSNVRYQINQQSSRVQQIKQNYDKTVHDLENKGGIVANVKKAARSQYKKQLDAISNKRHHHAYKKSHRSKIQSFANNITDNNQKISTSASQYVNGQIKAESTNLSNLNRDTKSLANDEFNHFNRHAVSSVNKYIASIDQLIAKNEQAIQSTKSELTSASSALNSLSNANTSALRSADNSAGTSVRKSDHSSRASQRSTNNSNNEQSANSFSNYKSAENSGANNEDSIYNSLASEAAYGSSQAASIASSVANSVSSSISKSLNISEANSLVAADNGAGNSLEKSDHDSRVAKRNQINSDSDQAQSDYNNYKSAESSGASNDDNMSSSLTSEAAYNSSKDASVASSVANSVSNSISKSLNNSEANSLIAEDNGAGDSLEKSDHDSRVAKRNQINSDGNQAQSDFNSDSDAESSGANSDDAYYNSLQGSIADESIAAYYQQSVANSISSANQSLASSYRNSVTQSVSSANHDRTNAAVQKADQKIDSEAASRGASLADQKIAASYSASVANSVSTANRSKADSAAQSVDKSIVNSWYAASLAAVDNGAGDSAEKSDHDSRAAKRSQMNSDSDRAKSDYDHYKSGEKSGASNDDDLVSSLASEASYNSSKNASIASSVADSVANSMNKSAYASRAASSAAQSASNHSQPQVYSYSSQSNRSRSASNASQNVTLENAVQGMSRSNAVKLGALVDQGVSVQVAKRCVLLEEIPKP